MEVRGIGAKTDPSNLLTRSKNDVEMTDQQRTSPKKIEELLRKYSRDSAFDPLIVLGILILYEEINARIVLQ